MRSLALAVLCLPFLQDPSQDNAVSRLVEKLSNDEIEIRDGARRDLLTLGAKALPLLRRKATTAELEIRERLLGVIREIERAERVTFFLREPRRIRLKAERRPIGEVLKDLSKQSETPVTLDGIPPEEPVTVEIADRPFFEALQHLCLAHGGILFLLPDDTFTLEDHAPVKLVRGDPKACRRFVEGPFVLTLESLYTTNVTLGPKRDTPATLFLQAGWERGIRPTRMQVEVTSVVDETGTSYAIPSQGGRDRLDIYIDRQVWVPLSSTPPPSVTTFREIRGKVSFEFPSDGYVARLEQPMGRTGVQAEGGPASFSLVEMVREGPDRLRVVLDCDWVANVDHLNRTRYYVLDSRDRIYRSDGATGQGSPAGKMRWTLAFDVPKDAEVKELRAVKFTIDKEHPSTVKFPWKLENVRFR